MVKFTVGLFGEDEFEKILRYGEEGNTEEDDAEVDSWEISQMCDMEEDGARAYFKKECKDFEKKPPKSAIVVALISADTDLGYWSVEKYRTFKGEG